MMPKTLKIAIFSILLIVFISFISLMAIGLSGKRPVTGQSGFTLIGNTAPDFNLILFDGNEFTLSDYYGSPIVLNFWASWCAPCRDEAISLEKSWNIYGGLGVKFVGVDLQDNEPDALSYIKEFGISYPNGRDEDGKITIDYGIVGMPVTFFVDRNGLVVDRWVGAISEKTLMESIELILR